MQSLFDACASKMAHMEITEIRALPIPKTATDFLLTAKSYRKCFNRFYERRLGDIDENCFVFGQYGRVLESTLANIEKSDLKQGFRFNCAFGRREQLAAIWQKLSDEEKAALNADSVAIVRYYSTLLAGVDVHLRLHIAAFMETLKCFWFAPFRDVYRNGGLVNKKFGLFMTWLTAVLTNSAPHREKICSVLCTLQRERDFEFDDDDREEFKKIILRCGVYSMETVQECAKKSNLEEFAVLLMETVGQSEQ